MIPATVKTPNAYLQQKGANSKLYEYSALHYYRAVTVGICSSNGSMLYFTERN